MFIYFEVAAEFGFYNTKRQLQVGPQSPIHSQLPFSIIGRPRPQTRCAGAGVRGGKMVSSVNLNRKLTGQLGPYCKLTPHIAPFEPHLANYY